MPRCIFADITGNPRPPVVSSNHKKLPTQEPHAISVNPFSPRSTLFWLTAPECPTLCWCKTRRKVANFATLSLLSFLPPSNPATLSRLLDSLLLSPLPVAATLSRPTLKVTDYINPVNRSTTNQTSCPTRSRDDPQSTSSHCLTRYHHSALGKINIFPTRGGQKWTEKYWKIGWR